MIKEDITDKTAKKGLKCSRSGNDGLEQVTEFSIHSCILVSRHSSAQVVVKMDIIEKMTKKA